MGDSKIPLPVSSEWVAASLCWCFRARWCCSKRVNPRERDTRNEDIWVNLAETDLSWLIERRGRVTGSEVVEGREERCKSDEESRIDDIRNEWPLKLAWPVRGESLTLKMRKLRLDVTATLSHRLELAWSPRIQVIGGAELLVMDLRGTALDLV